MMVTEISKCSIDRINEISYKAIDDGFTNQSKDGGKGYVELEIIPYFDDKTDEFISFEFSDNIMRTTGDYLPLSFNKQNLKELINFLSKQYERFS